MTSATALNDRQKQRLLQTLLELADAHLPARYAAVASDAVFEFGVWMIRVDVDGRGFRISIDECAQLSRLLVPHIEPLAELATLPYMIEIGSPGLFRSITTDREVAFYHGWAVALAVVNAEGEELSASATLPIRTGYLAGRVQDVWRIASEPFEGQPPAQAIVEVAAGSYPGLRVSLNPPVEWPADDEDVALED